MSRLDKLVLALDEVYNGTSIGGMAHTQESLEEAVGCEVATWLTMVGFIEYHPLHNVVRYAHTTPQGRYFHALMSITRVSSLNDHSSGEASWAMTAKKH